MAVMIYLIQSKTRWYNVASDEDRHVNLNLAYLRAAKILRSEGIEFQIVDFNNRGGTDEAAFVRQSDRGIFLISVDMMSVGHAYDLTKKIKNACRDNVVVWTSMGIGFLLPFSLIYREVVMGDEMIDYVFNGDETNLPGFIRALKFKGDVSSIPGVGYRGNYGKLYFTPLARDQAQYVEEDYDAVCMDDYLWRWGKEILGARYVKRQKIIPVSTGVGCAYSCSFCINSNRDWKMRFKLKPEQMLLAQLDMLIEKYSPDVIWFQDDNFFINKKRATSALRLLNNHGVKWCGQARADYFDDSYITDDYFREYIAPGVLWFGVGFETFSDRLRKLCGKDVTKEQFDKACELCANYDVPFNPAFIYGLPCQTREELKSDVEGLIAYRGRYPNMTFSYQAWRPYPGTLEFERLRERGKTLPFPTVLSEWNRLESDGLSPILVNGGIEDLVPLNELLIKACCREGSVVTRMILKFLYPLLLYGFKREISSINTAAKLLVKANMLKKRVVSRKSV